MCMWYVRTNRCIKERLHRAEKYPYGVLTRFYTIWVLDYYRIGISDPKDYAASNSFSIACCSSKSVDSESSNKSSCEAAPV